MPAGNTKSQKRVPPWRVVRVSCVFFVREEASVFLGPAIIEIQQKRYGSFHLESERTRVKRMDNLKMLFYRIRKH